MSTELKDRPKVGEPDMEDEDRMAHIVAPASLVTEAYITGTAVEALCGHTFVPTRDPENYPECQRCVEERDAILNGG